MPDLPAVLLPALGLPTWDDPGLERGLTFDDGGHYRVEIPSVEGVAAFEAVLDEAARLDVAVHRVSQGSGVMLLTDTELAEMAALGAEHHVEVCLFVGPRAPWEGTASALAPDGSQVGFRHSGMAQLGYALRDVERACSAGIRSLLLADEGLIWLVNQARARGDLPADLLIKGGASLGLSNPVQVQMLAAAGMDTANLTSDTSVGRLAACRAVVDIPLDLYIESPDGLGGFLRYHEIADVVRVAAPVHLKFGLRNSPGIYPAGHQLDGVVLGSARERVRRARIGLEHLSRAAEWAMASPTGIPRRGTPVALRRAAA